MSAVQETAFDVWDNAYRVRIKDHDDHIAVMVFDTVLNRFMRINLNPVEFRRIARNALEKHEPVDEWSHGVDNV